jgi:hypothetical protein
MGWTIFVPRLWRQSHWRKNESAGADGRGARYFFFGWSLRAGASATAPLPLFSTTAIVTSRSMSSCGVKTNAVVPSRQGRLSRSSRRPSSSWDSRSVAIGGRAR